VVPYISNYTLRIDHQPFSYVLFTLNSPPSGIRQQVNIVWQGKAFIHRANKGSTTRLRRSTGRSDLKIPARHRTRPGFPAGALQRYARTQRPRPGGATPGPPPSPGARLCSVKNLVQFFVHL